MPARTTSRRRSKRPVAAAFPCQDDSTCLVERTLDDTARRDGNLPAGRRSVSDVRWWWRRYSAPRYKVIEETIDGDGRTIGFLPTVVSKADGAVLVNVSGIVRTDERRLSREIIARRIRCYFASGTQEQIAEQERVERETVNGDIAWLRKQLKSVPIVVVTNKPPA